MRSRHNRLDRTWTVGLRRCRERRRRRRRRRRKRLLKKERKLKIC
jgi:hypothetical protein